MMFNLLRKRLLPPTSCMSLISRSLFSSTSQIHNPEPHFMVGYLIKSCGLLPEKAAVAATRLKRIKSPEKPDSVIGFLKQWGFDHTQIRRLVTSFPNVLGYNVEKPLLPNIKSLLEIGFSRADLPRLLLRNPRLLVHANIGPRIDFWRTLLGNDDNKLRTAMEKNLNLMNIDIARNVTPKITLLKNHGLSDQQIQKLLILGRSIFTSSTNAIQSLLKWTEDLRVAVDSPMFVYYLNALNRSRRPQYEAKMELLRTYGWSEHDFLYAFMKFPSFTNLSQKNIQAKMDFFVGTAGCKPVYIAHHPQLLAFSLEKRLMPRNHVFQILKAKEIKNIDFYCTMMHWSDNMFSEKCVQEFEDKVPQLFDIYENACSGRYMFLSS